MVLITVKKLKEIHRSSMNFAITGCYVLNIKN